MQQAARHGLDPGRGRGAGVERRPSARSTPSSSRSIQHSAAPPSSTRDCEELQQRLEQFKLHSRGGHPSRSGCRSAQHRAPGADHRRRAAEAPTSEIEDYYEASSDQFELPATRDVRLVLNARPGQGRGGQGAARGGLLRRELGRRSPASSRPTPRSQRRPAARASPRASRGAAQQRDLRGRDRRDRRPGQDSARLLRLRGREGRRPSSVPRRSTRCRRSSSTQLKQQLEQEAFSDQFVDDYGSKWTGADLLRRGLPHRALRQLRRRARLRRPPGARPPACYASRAAAGRHAAWPEPARRARPLRRRPGRCPGSSVTLVDARQGSPACRSGPAAAQGPLPPGGWPRRRSRRLPGGLPAGAAPPPAASPAPCRAPERRAGEPSRAEAGARAVARLDEITRRLRRECPWDREQDERSIVPHTVEEAYELADAAASRRRREDARRARRRPLPGPLPRPAARGARGRATWPRSPSTAARS